MLNYVKKCVSKIVYTEPLKKSSLRMKWILFMFNWIGSYFASRNDEISGVCFWGYL